MFQSRMHARKEPHHAPGRSGNSKRNSRSSGPCGSATDHVPDVELGELVVGQVNAAKPWSVKSGRSGDLFGG